MKAILVTACGATQMVDVEAEREVSCRILPPLRLNDPANAPARLPMITRRFRRDAANQSSELLVYREVVEATDLQKEVERLKRQAESFELENELLKIDRDNARKCYEALRAAIIKADHETCQILGKALGYPEAYPHASQMDDGEVVTGEHVPQTLAKEATERIAKLEADKTSLLSRWGRTRAYEEKI